jgi:hypothetical protein
MTGAAKATQWVIRAPHPGGIAVDTALVRPLLLTTV